MSCVNIIHSIQFAKIALEIFKYICSSRTSGQNNSSPAIHQNDSVLAFADASQESSHLCHIICLLIGLVCIRSQIQLISWYSHCSRLHVLSAPSTDILEAIEGADNIKMLKRSTVIHLELMFLFKLLWVLKIYIMLYHLSKTLLTNRLDKMSTLYLITLRLTLMSLD